MDLETLILSKNSKEVWNQVATIAIESPNRITEIIDFFESDNIFLVQRSTQIMSKIHDKRPDLLAPYFMRLINGLAKAQKDAYKRNVLRIFQSAQIPEAGTTLLFDKALTYIQNKEEAIAIQAFSFTVLRKICETYPELASEVKDNIELILLENKSAGIQNRGRKEVNRLKKLMI
ncbi:hypothetical protein DNU06_04640 [Putridiphycobacter roseus]|uniref:Uncharacterized protein n=1 Tax=Putridiphycobacter roseus TaxID=2219161 RepID=A0A2W1N2Y6_9FLAO|nr:hypothetical protein [Putridiphycobacter roseus]PZE17910.1 hypothetical protein DNU06_04640 [Putridiphycobacter roseus]